MLLQILLTDGRCQFHRFWTVLVTPKWWGQGGTEKNPVQRSNEWTQKYTFIMDSITIFLKFPLYNKPLAFIYIHPMDTS